jgi:hypothetical protein
MDKDTYYLFAVVLSGASSLISAINLFLFLRDRNFRTRCNPCFVSKAGSNEIFSEPGMSIDPITSAKGRAAILIHNDSMSPCTVQSITIRPLKRPFMKLISRLGEGAPMEGQFTPQQFPQVIKGREVCVFTFNPDQIRSNQFGQINVNFVGGGNRALDVATSYYRLSGLRRIISRIRAGNRLTS